MKKVDHEKSPYGALDHIDQIENDLFQMGAFPTVGLSFPASEIVAHSSILQVVSYVANRSTTYMAELLDLLHATVQRTRDPHHVTVMILQMATGKTN
ncbi:hypothetical protein IV203_002278 [Nitzschia inconspicua]|uniref:Uncharacterized protein n=1 Tax=Nitzschia inconspicua TaxID=303405 RepID=A0A9K3L894_9STRA|nr:hypothetical protein IV203_002278 [Nitzschia inconspicua]